MSYQAAKCYQELGDAERSLDHFLRVPRRHAQYRRAAVEAVHLARKLDVLDFQLEQFLTDFIASGPTDDRELDAFYVLGGLYTDNGFPDNAEEVFEKILEHDSSYRDAAERLADIRRGFSEQRRTLDSVLREDVAFWETDVGQDMRVATQTPSDAQRAPESAQPGGTVPFIVGPHGTVVLRTGAAGTGFEVGAVVADRYRIAEMIGRGGMAMVFRAADLELGEDVALKVFSQPVNDETALARFRQELKLSRVLTHPNIIQLFDIGVFLGFRYITMELLKGKVLAQLMGAPIAPAVGLPYLIQSCSALQLAHDKGVIHRDLKPNNLFITESNHIKVMDFGIAKFQAQSGMTSVGMLAGTPEYMSPEQINDFATVTGASDQYSLGVVAYEMFSGRRPFEHPGLGVLLNMHLQRPPAPPRDHNPSLPEELEKVILKLMSKKPEQRFSDCNELAEELLRIQGRLSDSSAS